MKPLRGGRIGEYMEFCSSSSSSKSNLVCDGWPGVSFERAGESVRVLSVVMNARVGRRLSAFEVVSIAFERFRGATNCTK